MYNVLSQTSISQQTPAFIQDYDVMSYKKGQNIYSEGNKPHGVYYLKTGLVKVFKLGSDGKEQIIKFAKTGSFLGYAEMITDSRYKSSATVIEDTKVVFIPQVDFGSVMQSEQGMMTSFVKMMYDDLIHAEEKMTDIAYKPVRGLLAEALLSLKESYQNKWITLSRNDMAKMIGTASETVIRLLTEFKKENLIKMDGRKIAIVDDRGLTRISFLYN